MKSGFISQFVVIPFSPICSLNNLASHSAGANTTSTFRRPFEGFVMQLLTHNLPSYMRRMKELLKQKLAAAEEAAE